jgi:signal transduction histidine kinase
MEQLLELGRPVEAPRGHVDLPELLGEAIAATEALARSAGVRVTLATHGPLPPLNVDRERMVQVFRNLVENSVQHSAAGAEVELRASRVAGAFVEVEVEDQGAGFAPEDLPHVFDPFFTRRRGGTGLGLAIVRRIVEEHGGSVCAANRKQRGARVAVRLRAGA